MSPVELQVFIPDDGKQNSLPSGKLYCTNQREATFLYQKIFVEREYGHLQYAPNGTIVDVGGNIGMFAAFAAKECGDASTVWVVEPMPPLLECLRRNVRPQDRVIEACASDEPGEAELDYLPNYTLLSGARASEGLDTYAKAAIANGGHIPFAQVAQAFEKQIFKSPVVTLADALKPIIDKGDRICVLKVDVEYMEAKVINGIDDVLWQNIDQVVIEVHDVDGRINSLSSLLRSKGFKVTVGELAPPCFLLGEGTVAKELDTCLLTATRF